MSKLIPVPGSSCTRWMAYGVGLVLALLCFAMMLPLRWALRADEATPAPTMQFGAVTHFAQGWPLDVMSEADRIGVGGIRDSLYWNLVETTPDVYDFIDPRTTFLDRLGGSRPTTIVFNNGNELYDDGATPHTDKGRKAAARFIVAALDRFPTVTAIEIGNEFNGQNFVSGPINEAPYAERAGYYFAILKTVYEIVKPRHPHVTILGGAAHSIPVGYFRQLIALGALSYMDGIVIHPYTSEPEQVADHIGILNAAMGADRVPIYATEVGQEVRDAADSAAYLVKMVVALAASGVASVHWYALLEQEHYSNMGLLDNDRTLRPAGRAFEVVQTLLRNNGNPRDISPDAMTYAYKFGENALVLWGEPRAIDLTPDVAAYDATGNRVAVADTLSLDPDQPLILLGTAPLVLGENVVLGPQRLIADSYHQFDSSSDPEGPEGFEGPWSYFALRGTGELQALHTQGGGAVRSEAWHPYIGHDGLRPLSVSARVVNPVNFGEGDNPAQRYAVVERYTSDRAQTVDIEGYWRVSERSDDGITLRITVDGREVYDAQTTQEVVAELPGVTLQQGSTVDFIVGINRNSIGGDTTERRIKISTAP